MADGSIRIDTKLDTTKSKADIAELEKECEKVAKKIEEAGKKTKTAFSGSSGMAKLSDDCEQAAEKMEEMGQTAKAVFTGMSKGQLNSAFKTANKELDKTTGKIAALDAEIANIKASTDEMLQYAATDDQASNLLEMEAQQTDPLIKKRDELTAKAKEYEEQLKQITAEIDRQIQEEAALKALDTTGKEAVKDADYLGKIKNEEEYQRALDTTSSKMAIIEQQAASIAQQAGVPAAYLLEQNKEYQTLARRQALLINNQDRFRGKVSETTSAIGKMEKQMAKTGRTIKTSLDHGIKKLTRMAVGILGVRAAFTALRRAASSYIADNEKLSNQLNAIWNILGTAIGPVIEKLVSWLTVGISYVNAFIKALTGVDIVAKANARALEKQAKAAEAASKAQTAGFDEINKLSDTSSSSGSDSRGSGQFEIADVDTGKIDKFIEKISGMKEIVLGILSGLLGWKILGAFGAPLSTCAKWFAIIAGSVAAIAEFIDMLKNGVDWENLATFIGGAAVAVAGLAFAFGQIGAVIGAVVAGIMLMIAGIKDWIENGKSGEALAAIETGILAIGVALAAVLGWIPLLVAALAGIAVAVTMYWDEIVAAAKAAWAWIDGNIIQPILAFFDPLIQGIQAVWDFLYKTAIEPTINFFKAVFDIFAQIFKEAWEIISGIGVAIWSIVEKVWEIFKKICEIFAAIGKAFYDYVIKPVVDFVVNIAKSVYTKAIKPVIEFFGKIFTQFYNAVIAPIIEKVAWLKNKLVDIFKTIGTTAVNFMSNLLKSVINAVLSGIEWVINKFIGLLNGAIGIINLIPGVNIEKITPLQIPRLAKGAIVNNPGKGVLATVGESGAEAVLPLENNTGWMDVLADKINGGEKQIVIQVILNGKKIQEEIRSISRLRNFATNGAI